MDPSNPSPLPLEKRRELSYALHYLAESYTKRDDWEVKSNAERALICLTTFINDLVPAPELNEYEGEVASSIHTYLRKYDDTPRGTMLYTYIKRSKGWGVWTSFVKGLVASRFDLRDALNEAQDYQHNNDTPDNLDMRLLLQMWTPSDFKAMMSTFKEGGWFEIKSASKSVVKN